MDATGVRCGIVKAACLQVQVLAVRRRVVLWHRDAGAGKGEGAPVALLLHQDHPRHCARPGAQPGGREHRQEILQGVDPEQCMHFSKWCPTFECTSQL